MIARDGERYRARGWWRDATFVDDLRGAARSAPERPAIIAARAFDRDAVRISYADLAERVDRLDRKSVV